MPRTETILRVFIASPSDLAEERIELERVVSELNTIWSRTLGIRLELVRWETHTYPSIGVDAQAVINQQVNDDYDIFIGLMWARFGTATARAGSGTAEEFYRAYKKHQDEPNQVRIMFYFKDAPISPSDLDPEQLISIKKFQKDLGEKGTYYWTYTSRDEFAQLVRMHLSLQVQEWGKSWGKDSASIGIINTTEPITTSNAEDIADDSGGDEEEGFFDLLESGQENLGLMTEALTRMSNATEDLGVKTEIGTAELNNAKLPGGNVDFKQAKRISNRIAEALNSFAALMEADVPVFATSLSNGIEAYSRAVSLAAEFGEDKESLTEVRNNIKELRIAATGSKSQMLSFREAVAGTPRTTTMYNRAKKRTLLILDRLDEEFASAINLISELEKVLDHIIGD